MFSFVLHQSPPSQGELYGKVVDSSRIEKSLTNLGRLSGIKKLAAPGI